MAARKTAPEPPTERPSMAELDAALTDFHVTAARLEVARHEHDAARVRLVSLLHAFGLTGFVL